MDMMELIMDTIALCGAIGVVVGMALLAHWGRYRKTGLVPYYFYPSLLYAGLDILTSNRDVSIPEEFAKTVAPVIKNSAVGYVGKLASLFLLMAVAERVVHHIFAKEKEKQIPKLLFFGMTVFFLTNVISPALFSAHPTMTHEYFYAYIACCGAILMTEREADMAFLTARNGFYVFLLTGLIVMVLRPSLVLNSNYIGLIPFLKVRLAGLANHPNGLGVIALLFMVSMWRFPFGNALLRWSGWMIAYANLVLAQSKTCWIAFFIAVTVIFWAQYRHLIKKHFLNYRSPYFSVMVLSTAMIAVTGLCIVFMFLGAGDKIEHFFTTRTGAELASFSGRDIIWNIALEEFHKHPIFGYGLPMWDEDFRKSINMANATSAHSQFYQSLSVAGIVGFTGLLLYIFSLIIMTIKTFSRSKGFSLAIFFILMSGCFSEVPLVMDSFGASPVIAHGLLLAILTSNYATSRKKSAVRQFAAQDTGDGFPVGQQASAASMQRAGAS